MVTAYDSLRVAVLSTSCASALPVGITLQVPNGGEQWAVGSEQVISWNQGGGVIAVDVEVTRDGGQNWELVAERVTGTSCSWTVAGPATGVARVRVTDATVAARTDASNANFGIGQPVSVIDGEARVELSPYPNPFAEHVEIEFDLPRDGEVVAVICDLNGRRLTSLLDRRLPAGHHRLRWNATFENGRSAPPGLYFVRIRTPQGDAMRPVIRIR